VGDVVASTADRQGDEEDEGMMDAHEVAECNACAPRSHLRSS